MYATGGGGGKVASKNPCHVVVFVVDVLVEVDGGIVFVIVVDVRVDVSVVEVFVVDVFVVDVSVDVEVFVDVKVSVEVEVFVDVKVSVEVEVFVRVAVVEVAVVVGKMPSGQPMPAVRQQYSLFESVQVFLQFRMPWLQS
mmetsp:Transcript_3138/g.7827  ORF Transcript_3138/g.7827 Transcript_3138/m.7827 type:complete len:140 (-) Transcript_3138:811-1230(-)